MMNIRTPLSLAALLGGLLATAQVNISFVGQLDYQVERGSNVSNLWGYTDELGNEYALVGVCGTGASNPGGIAVVSLADPANPQEIFFYPGPASIWREIKVWGDYAYITTEASNGELTIVDLSPLPQSTALNAIVWDAPTWTTSHSLFIDENGRLYIHGSNYGNGGVIMYDLTQDPMNPAYVGEFDDWYCHDSFARGDTLYAAHIYDGFFSVVDVSNPAAPVLLGTHLTPSEFTHNTWLDASGNYLFTTDERSNAYIGAYDVSDPTDISEVDRLRSDNGSGAIPHNTYWMNGYVIQSYYTYGVSVYDAGDPSNMIEVGSYDTSPFSGDGFNGAWGVYPFFSSGLLIVSDIEHGLFVLSPTYVQACRLEGIVSNQLTSVPIAGASVSIVGTNSTATTPIDGSYATGYYAAGTYSVQVSAPGYVSATINGVSLTNGVTTQLNVQLMPLVPFNVTGTVTTAGTGDPVPDAEVLLNSNTYSFSAQTDANGDFTVSGVFADDYEVTAGHWGWHTACLSVPGLNPGSGPIDIELAPGYADDFAIDLGWSATGTATSGMWERGIPVGTVLGNSPSNPGADATGDCGGEAYVTGNGGGAAGDDDVDGGSVILTSPVFDATGQNEPHVRYQRWFVNGGGSGNPNDQLTITLDNGNTTAVIETVTAATAGNGSWVQRDYRIADFITPSANMQVIVTTADVNPGHVVEAGFDVFELYYDTGSGLADRAAMEFGIYPNPSTGRFTVNVPNGTAGEVRVLDATGRIVSRDRITGNVMELSVVAPSGAYTVLLLTDDGLVGRARLTIVR